jgi:hypothetical protein
MPLVGPVVVTVTAEQTGTWPIAPYNHIDGLDQTSRYEVPVYKVTAGAKDVFEAVRFGLVRIKQSTPRPSRRCDAGLSKELTVKPTWIPRYSPHSFQLPGRPGAWRILPNKGFLVHQGTARKTQTGGSLGCVEIVGEGEWDRFLARIEALAGASCAEISKAQTLCLHMKSAQFPMAKLL